MPRKRLPRYTVPGAIAVALAASAAALAQVPSPSPSVDVLIKGGTIYDGSAGNRGYVGDVALVGDRIVYVGPRADVAAARTIDARGLIVAPGFIDPHAHAEENYLDDPDPKVRRVIPWIMQGVSTIVIGIDGFGTPDVADQFARFRQQGIGLNVVAHVGFGPIRKRVIGTAARAPTAAELEAEKALVVKGMCEGAVGFSAGLWSAPQVFAKTEEVIALAREAAKRGGIYDTHQRDEASYSIGLIASTREALRIGKEAGLPLHIAHIKALGPDVWGKSTEVIELINAARAAGQDVTADQYPYSANFTYFAWQVVPRWALEGGYPALIARLDDPATLAKIEAEMTENFRRLNGAHSLFLTTPGDMPWSGRYLDDVTKEWKTTPAKAAVRIVRQSEKQDAVAFAMAPADIRNFMKQPWVMTGSDGNMGHPRTFGTFPMKYRQYVRKEKLISMGSFIRNSTGFTADVYQLKERGYLRNGYFADVVILDPKRYAARATYADWRQPAAGVVNLFVNGKAAVDRGQPTAVLAGRPLPHTPTPGTCSD